MYLCTGAVIGLFLFFTLPGQAQSLAFQAATLQDPHYQISLPLELSEEGRLLSARLNGSEADYFLLDEQGNKLEKGASLKAGRFRLVFDHAWKSGRSYRAKLEINSGDHSRNVLARGAAPAEGGIPAGEEGFYRAYLLEEQVGLPRHQEIVYLTLTAPEGRFEADRLLVLDGAKPLPQQLLSRQYSTPAAAAAAKHPRTVTVKLAVASDLGQGEKKLLVVLRGRSPAAKNSFHLQGQGLAQTVDNGIVALSFAAPSGQINTIAYAKEGIKLFNSVGVIHWNPDALIPEVAWDHSFNWNPPPQQEEIAGPLVYAKVRRGPFPNIRDIDLTVKYQMAAAAPYFIVETRMQCRADLGVVALRNDEMVLASELFDQFVYRDKNGRLVKLDMAAVAASSAHGRVAADDLAWVGMLNSRQGYGFFSLRLEYANIDLRAAGSPLYKNATQFYPEIRNGYVYWVRPLFYTWADQATDNLLTAVPKDSTFYEKNAYLAMSTAGDYAATLDRLSRQLKNPIWRY